MSMRRLAAHDVHATYIYCDTLVVWRGMKTCACVHALGSNLISQVHLAALCNGRHVTESWCAGRYVPRAVLMDLVSQASWLSSCSKRLLCLNTLCYACCKRLHLTRDGCRRSQAPWTQCAPAHSARSSGPTTSYSARYLPTLAALSSPAHLALDVPTTPLGPCSGACD